MHHGRAGLIVSQLRVLQTARLPADDTIFAALAENKVPVPLDTINVVPVNVPGGKIRKVLKNRIKRTAISRWVAKSLKAWSLDADSKTLGSRGWIFNSFIACPCPMYCLTQVIVTGLIILMTPLEPATASKGFPSSSKVHAQV
ncbi:Protein of unknown function [Cotesia congregata]|uniref:Uncharacterized protein n=1 Tax=Cotesia congregata TaxID=51543 RepID=A0A8J2MKL1_COTCN|nr:Protein of unknown function [Cotesia congregata]